MPLPRSVRNSLLLLPVTCALAYGAMRLHAGPGTHGDKATIGKQNNGTYLVPTGQTIQPVGKYLPFDNRPLDLALRPDGKLLAVMTGSNIRLLNTVTGAFDLAPINGGHNFGGIAWSKDGSVLYSTSNSGTGMVAVTKIDAGGVATELKPIKFTSKPTIHSVSRSRNPMPCALALSPDGNTLYVALFNNCSVAAVDLTSYDGSTGTAKISETAVGSSPDRIVVSPGGDKIYVANRGGKVPEKGDTMDFADPVVVDPDTFKANSATISVVNAATLASDPEHAVVKTINVGLQPADLAISPDGKRVFTANANAETVSVISTSTDEVIETIPTSPAPGQLAASCPNGLALTPNGKTLYVTLGGDNAVEVVSLDTSAGGDAHQTNIAGLIPTAWFPLAVRLSADAKTLYVANSKGFGSVGPIVDRPRANNGVFTPEMGPGGVVDTANLVGKSVYAIQGSLSVVDVPDTKRLAAYTKQAAVNAHFDTMKAAIEQPADPYWSRFKHVVLIIKENRTYDQVYGDVKVPAGHVGGDPNLVMFGRKVTPNQHALAEEFGLLDNIYCCGTISADGHHWLNEVFASDYAERMMNDYPRSYPCCGTDPLVYAGNQFVWQAAQQAGKSFYNYGEFSPLPSIQRNGDHHYGAAFELTPERNVDVAHSERIIADILEQQKGDGKDSHPGLAQLTTIWLPNNHTSGTRAGSFTPEADVADNDLAVGKIIETISHSKKYWQDEPTAIFIIEDDAQGGLDHVDGHRTGALVISPFNHRKQVVSYNFNQLSVMRTVELILGLKPLNQFDAAAIPMRALFQEKADFTAFTALKNQIALNLRNPAVNKTAGIERQMEMLSSTLDFSEPDKADPEKLTKILWHHTHGEAAYPPVDAAY